MIKITDEQAEVILRWRWVGMSYRRIGKKLGLSHETIRNYCKENNIAHG